MKIYALVKERMENEHTGISFLFGNEVKRNEEGLSV